MPARLFLLSAALLALAACETAEPALPQSVGETGEIIVVTDSVTWAGPVGDALRETLGRSVAPPLGGLGDFRFRRQNLTDQNYPFLRAAKGLIFAAALDDTSAVARFLEARLDSAGIRMIRSGEGTIVAPRRDLWARDQIVVLAAAATDSSLADALRSRADSLRAAFTSLVRADTEREMFSRGRQRDLEDSLMQAHGFTVNVQHDYFLSQDTTLDIASTEGRFVRLRRVLSDTWRDLFVYYEPATGVDTPRVEVVTDAVLERLVRGQYDSSYVALDRVRPVRTTTTALAGRPAYETRGLWRMTEDFMGGPFVRYAFYDDATDRLYVIFGMIYAPQHRFRGDKREFLRQLEVIAHTFRTRQNGGA